MPRGAGCCRCRGAALEGGDEATLAECEVYPGDEIKVVRGWGAGSGTALLHMLRFSHVFCCLMMTLFMRRPVRPHT